MEKNTIELPIAWITRLNDYTAKIRSDEISDNEKHTLIVSLLGYLDSLSTLVELGEIKTGGNSLILVKTIWKDWKKP